MNIFHCWEHGSVDADGVAEILRSYKASAPRNVRRGRRIANTDVTDGEHGRWLAGELEDLRASSWVDEYDACYDEDIQAWLEMEE